jgi:hypothetical protein
MSLNAKEDRQQILARGVEAASQTLMRANPAGPAIADVADLVAPRGDPKDEARTDAPPAGMDHLAAATAKPPSSLLDYRLVRVSSKLEDMGAQDGDTPAPAVGWHAGGPSIEPLHRDKPAQCAIPSRRLSQGLMVLLAISLVSILCIGAVFAL